MAMVTVEGHTGRETQTNPATPGADDSGMGAAREVTTFVGRADDGVEVSVGVRPEPGAGQAAVLLDLGTAAQEPSARVRLGPDEAHRLAAALSAAACAAVGCTPRYAAQVGWTISVPTRSEPESEPDTEVTEITAVEGTAAAELTAALALLPPGAVLIDFGADADVSLFFGPPAAAVIAARTWQASA